MLAKAATGVVIAAVAMAAVSVHGPASQRHAITRAIDAPFANFERGEARALCSDFIPSISADFARAVPGRSCNERVARVFRFSSTAGKPSPRQLAAIGKPAGWPIHLTAVSVSGDHARGTSMGPNGKTLHWRLTKLAGQWRLATPATLEASQPCDGERPTGSCVYGVWFRFRPSS